MVRLTQPVRLDMQPIGNPTKLRRQRGGTVARRKEAHGESSMQTEANSDTWQSPICHPGARAGARHTVSGD